MNKIMATLIAVFILQGTAQAQVKNINLTGIIEHHSTGTVYLQRFNNKIFETIDSAKIIEGQFAFETSVPLPELYGLTMDKEKTPLYIFLEDAPITVTLDTSQHYVNTVITGSTAQARFEDFRNESTQVNIRDFILDDPSSIVSAYVLYRNYAYRLSTQEILENVALLAAPLQQTQYVNVLKDLAKTMKGVAVGKIAPDFTSKTPDGKTERFSDHFGKNYILLDFWAAWCGPCRRENPNVVAAMNAFGNKGFAVYGVSLDKNREAWLKAIQDDQLNWTQVSDLTFWKSEAADLYGVRAIPSNFLIAPNGEIVARNLKGEDLHKKLAELLTD